MVRLEKQKDGCVCVGACVCVPCTKVRGEDTREKQVCLLRQHLGEELGWRAQGEQERGEGVE